MRPLVLALLLATPAAAATVTLTRDGAPVSGEVCRFRAGDASNPFKRWFASQDVVCDGAVPRGSWNVFGRTADAISAPVLVNGDDVVSLELVRAATVVPVLPQGKGGLVYVPRRGSGYAFDDRTERVSVPAGEELWLFVVDKGKPVALFPVAAIEAGKELRVDARGDGPSSVVGWLRIADEDRAAIANMSGLVAPGVRAGTRESDPLPSLRFLDGALFRVRDVPAGDAELQIEGRGWLHDHVVVKVEKTLTVAPSPLTVRASGNLTVHWNTGADLIALNNALGSCEETRDSSYGVIAISSCPRERPGQPFDPKACAPVREERFDPLQKFGSVTLDDVVPGTYRAELHFGKLPPIAGQVAVPPMQTKEIFLEAMYFAVYGSVTRGGDPLGEKVQLEFPTGPGFAPADSEEYHATLRGLVGLEAQIKVKACDGSPSAVVLADEGMRLNVRYDVDIPANKLTLTVTDTFTREPLRGSTVKYEVMSLRVPKRVVMAETVLTDGDGRMVIEGVPVREIHLAVSRPGYQKQELEPFTMPKRDEKEIDVQLVPLRGNNGKILSDRAFENGVVVWYSAGGSETERADVDADGTFIYMNEHAPDETMAVVSRSHPLWVFHSPQLERHQAIKVRYPNAPVRNVTVGLATANRRDSWHIGFVIGGVRVPPPVFAMHQAMRKEPFVARGDQPLQARDLLETGPIDVLLGPTTAEFSERGRPFDIFALPKYANVPRERLVPGETHVTFTP